MRVYLFSDCLLEVIDLFQSLDILAMSNQKVSSILFDHWIIQVDIISSANTKLDSTCMSLRIPLGICITSV